MTWPKRGSPRRLKICRERRDAKKLGGLVLISSHCGVDEAKHFSSLRFWSTFCALQYFVKFTFVAAKNDRKGTQTYLNII